MWDFFETVRHRHSIRKYQPDMPVEAEKLHAILEMACAAPSAGDLQAYRIIVVRDPAERRALVHVAHEQGFIAEAPVCLVFCADPARSAATFGERGARLYAVQDATIAATYAMLAAADQGLSTVWVGAFDPAKVTAAIGAPPDWTPVAILPIGYAAESPAASTRRPLAEFVHKL